MADLLQAAASVLDKTKDLPHASLTSAGVSALWFVFIVQGIAALVFTGLAVTKPVAKREHFYVTTAVVLTAMLSYYAMATGNGYTTVTLKDGIRDVYYARYLDWLVTTPLLLVDVLLITKLPIHSWFFAIFADVAMVITGLFGGVLTEEYRWGWFLVGCLFMVAIFLILFQDGGKYVQARDSSMVGFYNTLVLSLIILWTAYPIVWAFAEGNNYLSANTEAYLYGILDITAKVGFGTFILANDEKLQASYSKGSGEGTEPLMQA